MKINGILLVNNEADILEEALLSAMKFCHKIYVCDNGSTDGSWALVNEMSSRFSAIVTVELCCLPFHQPSVSNVYNTLHRQFSDDDWWYLLKADEVFAQSPERLLKEAVMQGSNGVNAWCAEFYFTDEDLANYELEDTSLPFAKRRKYYRIHNQETRFFKNAPKKTWSGNFHAATPSWITSIAKTAPIVMRFSERCPTQMQIKAGANERSEYDFDNANTPIKLTLKKAKALNTYYNDGDFVLHKTTRIASFAKALVQGALQFTKLAQLGFQVRFKKTISESTIL